MKNMSWYRIIYRTLAFTCIIVSCSSSDIPTPNPGSQVKGPAVDVWLTTPNRGFQFSKGTALNFVKGTTSSPTINIDTVTQYQTMVGFGYALTGGSAQLLKQKLIPSARTGLLKELFLPEENGIGVSYLRISIGASDLDDNPFSYDDLPAGETDVTLANFSIAPDQVNLIPILKEILAINPDVKIMGSPWSAPPWMKTNQAVKGGSLKPEYYAAYANYFVKYIQAMQAEGIPIDAITVQNEPEYGGNTPSMLMTATEQNDFIKNHLGPAFVAAGITTKIVLFDHNCDHPIYPITILNDPVTKAMVDGSAFHLYGGDVSALSTVHNAHPEKSLYFTEQWTSGNGSFADDLRWHVKNLVIGVPRNWGGVVLEWNLASDENFNPHTDGGCDACQGALTINSTSGAVAKNVSYYIIAHGAKLVRPGSVRIATNVIDNLPNVAFVTPDGKKVLIVVNDSNDQKVVPIAYKNMIAVATLPAGAVATYSW